MHKQEIYDLNKAQFLAEIQGKNLKVFHHTFACYSFPDVYYNSNEADLSDVMAYINDETFGSDDNLIITHKQNNFGCWHYRIRSKAEMELMECDYDGQMYYTNPKTIYEVYIINK